MGGGSVWGATTVHTDPTLTPVPSECVDLWVVDLGLQSERAALRQATTSAEERERATRLRRSGDGERFLIAHGALRLILAEYSRCDPLALQFSTESLGKPFIPGASLHFNLSHSGALALIAVAHGRQVGVDVEQMRPIRDLEGVADRICTPEERALLTSCEPSRRQGAFLALWTRKEALAKLTGEGARALTRDVRAEVQGDYRLVDVLDLPGYAACVAATGTTWTLVRRDATNPTP